MPWQLDPGATCLLQAGIGLIPPLCSNWQWGWWGALAVGQSSDCSAALPNVATAPRWSLAAQAMSVFWPKGGALSGTLKCASRAPRTGGCTCSCASPISAPTSSCCTAPRCVSWKLTSRFRWHELPHPFCSTALRCVSCQLTSLAQWHECPTSFRCASLHSVRQGAEQHFFLVNLL